MRVILLKDVKNLGRQGEIVELANGYARNFLIPQKLARFADQATINAVREQKTRMEKKTQNQQKLAQNLAKKLAAITLELDLPAAALGKLYAGLKDTEILFKLRERIGKLPQTTSLKEYSTIKTTGEHIVNLVLVPGVETKVKISIRGNET